MMNTSKVLLCFLVCITLLAGCGQSQHTEETTQPSQATAAPATEPATESTIDPEVIFLRENLPLMDGSTSLIPLEAGIRSALFDISQEEALQQVNHSSTWLSFYNLLDGLTDLIFSCPLSEQQLQQAEYNGVGLEAVPIAMEGFVFVVNANNPVDSLSQQQLKDIYSGKITNWAEVGGLDESIIPYQRNSDSGSQNYMLEFMGSTPLMDAPTEMRPASMSGLMDVIAVNDNSRAAIGYSVYAYAADMYGNGDEIKFVQIDGVAPSKTAFASGEYPLMGYNYAVFRTGEPEDGSVRRLVSWILTEQGQTAIAEAGYVPLMDIDIDYSESTLEKYQGIGTGPPAGEAASTEYVLLDTMYYGDGTPYASPKITPEVAVLPDGTQTYRISGLADDTLEGEINGWINDQVILLQQEYSRISELIENWNEGNTYHLFEPGFPWNDAQSEGMDLACTVTAKNGYFSVAITAGYAQHAFYSYARSYRTETATWDLVSGRRLKPEDLFCQGVQIHSVLNDYIRTYSQAPVDHTGLVPEMKQDFAALPTSGWHITHDTLYFDYSNPYFAHGVIISLDDLPDGTLACEVPRDFSQALEEGGKLSSQEHFRVSDRDFLYRYTSDGYASYTLLKPESHPYADAINYAVSTYLETHFTEDAIRSHFAAEGYGYDCSIDTGMGLDWYLTKLGEEFLIFRGTSPMLYAGDEIIGYPYPNHIIYDLRTGKQISWQDMLTDGWEEGSFLFDGDTLVEGIDLNAMKMDFIFYIQNDWNAPLCVCFSDGHRLEVPTQYIRH